MKKNLLKAENRPSMMPKSIANRHRCHSTDIEKSSIMKAMAGRHIANPIMFSMEKNKENDDVSPNSLWVTKIGGKIVGMARLVQDDPQKVRIAFFRVSPEWSHTNIAVNLIDSIRKYCDMHGGQDIVIHPGTVPPWLCSVMNNHGVQCV